MDSRKPVNGQAAGLMIVLGMTWGLQQVVLKATAQDIAPILQIGLRSGVAALLVGLVLLMRGERLSFRDGIWLPGLTVGLLFALEYLALGEGLRHTSASHAVVFLYTAPIFAAVGLHWRLLEERLRPLQWCGIALAFAGIVVAFFSRPAQFGDPSSAEVVFGDLLALLAGLLWGMTTVIIRCTALARSSASQTLLYQLIGAFLLLSSAAVWLGQGGINPTPAVWGSLLFQSVVVSFASFLLWFWLLRHYLASQLGVFSFLTPFFGVLFGRWFLKEPLEPSFLLGAACVLSGIGLVSGYGWIHQLAVSRYRDTSLLPRDRR